MVDKPKKGEIEFVFKYDPDYRICAANGVWGMWTPRGDLKLDFFVESGTVPQVVKHEIDENGLGHEIIRIPTGQMTRTIQTSVLFSVKNAENLVKFLNKKIEQYHKSYNEMKK